MKIAWDRKLDSRDIKTLNQRLAIELLTSDALNIVLIIQKNKTCHLINYLQIEKVVYVNNRDIIIFPVEDYKMKKMVVI